MGETPFCVGMALMHINERIVKDTLRHDEKEPICRLQPHLFHGLIFLSCACNCSAPFPWQYCVTLPTLGYFTFFCALDCVFCSAI